MEREAWQIPEVAFAGANVLLFWDIMDGMFGPGEEAEKEEGALHSPNPTHLHSLRPPFYVHCP